MHLQVHQEYFEIYLLGLSSITAHTECKKHFGFLSLQVVTNTYMSTQVDTKSI